MEDFIRRLDTLLDNDPFGDIDENLLSTNDLQLMEKYRSKYVGERQRIRNERKTKTFEEIMEDLLQELAVKPDVSSFYRTLDEPLPTSNSIRNDMHTIELDTSADEQDDLDHCAMTIDPTKSIGHSTEGAPLQTSTYVVYPLTKSPSVPPPSRKLTRYTEQARRNTYTLDESSSDDDPPLINTKPDYVRLDSQGFDPEQEDNVFHDVKDARSTFSIPTRRPTLTRQVAQATLHRKLAALIKGHLTRQLFRTEHVKGLVQTLHDTRKFAVDFQTQCVQAKTKLDPEDINIIDQLIRQVESVLNEIHTIFGQYSPARRILMILRDEQSHQLRSARTHQRMAKDFSSEIIHRPVIDPAPAAIVPTQHVTRQTVAQQSDYQRPENIRRHVTAAANRPVSSTSNIQSRPLKKATSVQRKSRPLNSAKNAPSSTNPPPRSSSANNNNQHAIRPPLRLAPASPLFRNRLK